VEQQCSPDLEDVHAVETFEFNRAWEVLNDDIAKDETLRR
jgi:hypothetical protein